MLMAPQTSLPLANCWWGWMSQQAPHPLIRTELKLPAEAGLSTLCGLAHFPSGREAAHSALPLVLASGCPEWGGEEGQGQWLIFL